MNKNDKKYLIFFGLLSLISALFFVFDKPHSMTSKEQGKIATIFKQNNIVKKRKENNLSWHNLRKGSFLYNNEYVYTLSNATATIHLHDNTIILLSPNTLIKVHLIKDNLGISLEKGMINIKNSPERTNLNLKIKDKNFKIKSINASMTISTNKFKSNIFVTKGKIKFGEKKKEKDSNKNIKLTLISEENKITYDIKKKETTISPLEISLLSPANNLLIKKDFISFKWKSKNHLIKSYQLVISKFSNFKTTVYKKITTKKQLKLKHLPRGTYFWTIVSRLNKRTLRSKINIFSTNSIGRPLITSPIADAYFSVEDQSEVNIPLKWEKNKTLYFEVAYKPAEVKKYKIHKTQYNFFILSKLTPGVYHWKVRYITKAARFSPWTRQRSFTVGINPNIKLAIPRNGDVYNINNISSANSGKQIKFNWIDVLKQSYTIVISKDINFENIVFKNVTNKKFINWDAPLEGKYYWKIIPENNIKVTEDHHEFFVVKN